MQKRWLQIYFLFGILMVAFAGGIWVGARRLLPYRVVATAWQTARTLRQEHEAERPPHVYKARYEGEGVVASRPELMQPGPTLITGVWQDEDEWYLGAHLLADDGAVLHRWHLDPATIWPRSPHSDWTKGSKNHRTKTYLHGSHLYENGDLVFNFECMGLVKVNAASEVLWKLPRRTHHSVFPDEDGSLWVCGLRWHGQAAPRFVGLKAPFVEDTIMQVSTDGEILREVSLLDVLYNSGYKALLFSKRASNSGDVTHLNDVEVLSTSKAAAFPMFEAGDILVSLRYANALLVIDGKTERVKWALTHRTLAQHDPDFMADGRISVFDNNLPFPAQPDTALGGTQILAIAPSTKAISRLYGDDPKEYFYTKTGGKHQHLSNGNMTITESRAGRVFEVTPDGETVWDWRAPQWEGSMVAEVLEGSRYASSFASFATPLKQESTR